jgi:CheY-like chemotaxis protein
MDMPVESASPDSEPLVLIVEDEEPIAEALALIVEEAGYRAVIAAHGREALDQVHQERPALIITDLMMPYMDGARLIEALEEEVQNEGGKHIPVILMTAAGGRRLEGIHPDVLLRKPFDMDEVEDLLRQFLDQQDDEDKDESY